MKKQVSFLLSLALFLGISTLAFAQNELPGRLVGTVNTNSGKTIYLSENLNNGVYSIAAYTKNNNKFVPENAFKVRKNYRSVINSVKYEDWYSSCPDKGFFYFNSANKDLYIPLIDDDMLGADKYIVYHFDGNHFIYKGQEGGYWLHQSIRSFVNLWAIGKTQDFLIRIDHVSDGSLRYAAWSAKKTMKDKPSIILYNDDPYESEGVCFYNGEFRYVINHDNNELKVYEGSKLIKRQKMEFLFW